jgi:hypothetical protein
MKFKILAYFGLILAGIIFWPGQARALNCRTFSKLPGSYSHVSSHLANGIVTGGSPWGSPHQHYSASESSGRVDFPDGYKNCLEDWLRGSESEDLGPRRIYSHGFYGPDFTRVTADTFTTKANYYFAVGPQFGTRPDGRPTTAWKYVKNGRITFTGSWVRSPYPPYDKIVGSDGAVEFSTPVLDFGQVDANQSKVNSQDIRFKTTHWVAGTNFICTSAHLDADWYDGVQIVQVTAEGESCNPLDYTGEAEICDGNWHKIPGGGITNATPVITFIAHDNASMYRDSVGVVVRGNDDQLYYQNFYTGEHNGGFKGWHSYWLPRGKPPGGRLDQAPYTYSIGSAWDIVVMARDSRRYHLINWGNGWTDWRDDGPGAQPWGTPTSAVDDQGRTWEVRQNPPYSSGVTDNIEYRCIPPPGTIEGRVWLEENTDDYWTQSQSPYEAFLQNDSSAPCTTSLPYRQRSTPGLVISLDGVNQSFVCDGTTGPSFRFDKLSAGQHSVSITYPVADWTLVSVTDYGFCCPYTDPPILLPVSQSISVEVKSKQTHGLHFGLKPGGSGIRYPYLITAGGDVHASGGIGFGVSCGGSGNIKGQTAAPLSYGEYVVSAGGNVTSFGSAGDPEVSSLSFTGYGTICRPDLVRAAEDFAIRFPALTTRVMTEAAVEDALKRGDPEKLIIYTGGSLTLNSSVEVNRHKTLYIREGSLNIRDDITLNPGTVADRSLLPSFGAIARDDISISGKVSTLEGFYFAGGRIDTCSDGITAKACATTLEVGGLLMANNFLFQRTGAASAGDLAETVNPTALRSRYGLLFLATPPAFSDFISPRVISPRGEAERPPIF